MRKKMNSKKILSIVLVAALAVILSISLVGIISSPQSQAAQGQAGGFDQSNMGGSAGGTSREQDDTPDNVVDADYEVVDEEK